MITGCYPYRRCLTARLVHTLSRSFDETLFIVAHEYTT
jgi:hypothetical protein